MSTIKGTFSLSHQYINTFYNSYRLHVSAFAAIFYNVRNVMEQKINVMDFPVFSNSVTTFCVILYWL